MNGPSPANPAIPYRSNSVTFIQWLPGGKLATSNEVDVKRQWLTEKRRLYAAWNGQRRTDVFEVDVAAAREALR